MWPPRARSVDLARIARNAGRVRRGPVTIVRGEGRACVGYAVGKSVGDAVTRNRVRRRLREAVRLGVDQRDVQATFLVVGRRAVLDVPFGDLRASLRDGFRELHGRNRAHGMRAG